MDEVGVTHRIHWRASCDAQIMRRGFEIHRTHEARVRQAGYVYESGLIADRCHFGPRRLILEGEVDYTPPRWTTSHPARHGSELAESTIRWTLRSLYDMGDRSIPLGEEPEPENLRIEVRVRPATSAAA